MSAPAPKLMTVEEFLRWDDGTDRKFELVDGVVRLMAPPPDTHGTIVVNTALAIGRQLRPDCRIIAEAGLRPRSFYQADLAITCAPPVPGGSRMIEHPVVIIEVLSPGTADHDRERKALDYRSFPSIQEVVLIATTARHVEIWRRDGERWNGHDFIGDAVARLESFAIDLPLIDVYRNVVLAPEPEGYRAEEE